MPITQPPTPQPGPLSKAFGLPVSGPHAGMPVYQRGEALGQASHALILVHGRGGSAEEMLNLADNLAAPGFIYLAPQAFGRLWYPNRYNTPLAGNEPFLSSALAVPAAILARLDQAAIPAERVVLAGFSQGACICAEFAARNARRYGGLGILAGGLIGPAATPRNYPGSLAGTPTYLGCSDPDEYFSPEWIESSAAAFRRLGGAVDKRMYPNLGHRISLDMIHALRAILETR